MRWSRQGSSRRRLDSGWHHEAAHHRCGTRCPHRTTRTGRHGQQLAANDQGTTGKKPDPRSFCIQKTLQRISHSEDCDHQLMFSGHNAYRFASDPFYAGGHIPTVRELVERLQTGQ